MTSQHPMPHSAGGQAALEQVLLSLLAPGAVVVIATPEMYVGTLAESERAGTERMVESRLRTFTAGRLSARHALWKLGAPVTGIPRGPDRAPRWPPGVVGSITHCEGLCVAVVARASNCVAIGIDAESATPLEQDLYDTVCRLAEQDHFLGLPVLPGTDWPKVAFSVKESFYKAWFPVTGTPLEFTDVELTIDPVARTVRFSVLRDDEYAGWGADARGRFEIVAGHLVTGVAIPWGRTTAL